jgi:U2 small nuclear ribonucleoprotein B''
VPDEYLPPNKILFLQNLPATATKEVLEKVFKQWVTADSPLSRVNSTRLSHRYPNLFEVRTIPTRADIAFVEYTDEAASSTARDALHNSDLDGQKIKVTFAKRS